MSNFDLNSDPASAGLMKEQLAASMRTAILEGRLTSGQRVVEARWSNEFGVAQATVREAINALIGEGFLVKDAGRSARVVRYTDLDIQRIYEVREALEGQSARLAVLRRADLSEIERSVDRMTAAFEASDINTLLRCDLQFHLDLAEASGNPLLADMTRRLVAPLFAFTFLRVAETKQGAEGWSKDVPRHRRILDLLKEGDADVAALHVGHCMRRFSASAHAVWTEGAIGKPRRKA